MAKVKIGIIISTTRAMAPTRTGVHIQGADFMAVWKGAREITELFVSPTECHRHARPACLVG